jgi:hypothetical protein
VKPAIVTLTIIAGQTFKDRFVFENTEGDREDFTGYSARMQIREYISSPGVVLELTTDNTLIAPLDDEGTVIFAVPAEVTSALGVSHDYETLWYDLEIFTPDDDDVQRLMQGAVVVWPETTRS